MKYSYLILKLLIFNPVSAQYLQNSAINSRRIRPKPTFGNTFGNYESTNTADTARTSHNKISSNFPISSNFEIEADDDVDYPSNLISNDINSIRNKNLNLRDSKNLINPYLNPASSNRLSKNQPLRGSLSSLSRIRPKNTTIILMGRNAVLCKEPNKSWDTLKITVKSNLNGVLTSRCRNNVCGYLTRSTRSTVVVKYLADTFKNRGTWNEKIGTFNLDKILVADEANYECAFSYITEPNKIYSMNMVVIAPPRSNIIEASVLVDRSNHKASSYPAATNLASSLPLVRPSVANPEIINPNKNSGIVPGAVNIFICKAANSKPQAKIFWRWENMKKRPLDWHEQIEVVSTGKSGKLKTVTNTLIFTPKKEYDRQKILCVVEHEGLPTGRWTQSKQLNVQYKPIIHNIKRSGVNELTCMVSGNPPPQVAWTFTRNMDKNVNLGNSLFTPGQRHNNILTQKINGNKINLFHNRISPNDTIQCVAENAHGLEHKTVMVSSLINSYGRSNMWRWFKYFLVVALVIVILLIISFKVRQKMYDNDKAPTIYQSNLNGNSSSGNNKNSSENTIKYWSGFEEAKKMRILFRIA